MSLLVDLAFEQLERPRVILHDRPELLVPWKEWTCYRGSAHVTRLAGKCSARYVDGRESAMFGGQVFPTLAETEVRSAYMARACGRSKWSWADEEGMLEIAGHELPGYSAGAYPEGLMACMDIEKFYLQVMRAVSTQVEYRPHSGLWAPLGNGWPDTGELGAHKALYAACVTAGWRRRTRTIWKHGKPEQQPSAYFYQPQAWRLLCDIAQAMASEALGGPFGCRRIMVDEFWVPDRAAPAFSEWLQQRWGFTVKLKKWWQPGDPWPTRTYDRVRRLPQLVRDGLAQTLTGSRPIRRGPAGDPRGR